tara:strand:+ start:198 stop:371 length:174 start_codon:yes stop_codon:yes gene_type:complete
MDGLLYFLGFIAVMIIGFSSLSHLIKFFEGKTDGNSFWFIIALVAFGWACLALTENF